MKRAIIGVVLASFVAGMCVFAVEAQQGRRQTNRGRRRAKTAAKVVERPAPQSKRIAVDMGEVRWGMTRDQVYNILVKKIREKYRPQLAKAPGAIEEDRIRAQQTDEVRRIHDSYVRFSGRTTGWDVSFIRDEYTHGNNEAMLASVDANSQNFYFFINNRLWKWYKAFNADVFQGNTFAQFASAVQTRFGPARERQGELIQGGGERHWLEWQDQRTRLRAIDNTRFYGFYCLVFEEKDTLAQLDRLRTNTIKRGGPTKHALVDSVTSGQGERADPDENPDIVDRITGRIRQRRDAPEQATKQQGATTATKQGATTATKNRTGSSSTPTGTGRASGNTSSGDPFRDMDL